uniref:Leucine-rich repeat extensin-like protein 3 n=1 Tax=Nelumbo nucifera TaxID=4432 RepID=A0A822YY42_NELNU|nr:TPA_asm: hypothetical protein HUJ06_006296 [Nelumbo nucifera]
MLFNSPNRSGHWFLLAMVLMIYIVVVEATPINGPVSEKLGDSSVMCSTCSCVSCNQHPPPPPPPSPPPPPPPDNPSSQNCPPPSSPPPTNYCSPPPPTPFIYVTGQSANLYPVVDPYFSDNGYKSGVRMPVLVGCVLLGFMAI